MMTRLKAFLAAFRFPSVDGEDWDHGQVLQKAEQDYLNTARNPANLEHRQRQIALGFLRRSAQA